MLVPWVVSYDRLNCTPCGLLEGLQLEIEVVVLAIFPRSVAKHIVKNICSFNVSEQYLPRYDQQHWVK